MRLPAAILLLAAALLPAGELRLVPLFAQAEAHQLLEWRVEGADPRVGADPAGAPAVVFAQDGASHRRGAFLYQRHRIGEAGAPVADGPAELRIRHTARAAGALRWQLVGPDGVEAAAGEVAVAAGRGPAGPIRVAANPRLLAFADGTPFIPIGPNIAWADGDDRLALFERYFTRLAQVGGTHARVWLASWCGQITGSAAGERRLDHGWLIDQVLGLARAHGLRLTIVLDNHHDLEHGKCAPYGDAPAGLDGREARLLAFLRLPLDAGWLAKTRYIMARWGADDAVMAWELCNELDMAEPIRERTLPWVRAAAAELKRLDQDRRPHGISWAAMDDWERPMGMPGIDLVQLRGYVLEWEERAGPLRQATRDGVGMLEPLAQRALRLGKPFLLGESGYQGTNERNPGNDIDRRGLLLRQQAWAGLLAGGCGSGMNWWWDNYIDRNDLWDVYRGLAAAAGRIDWRDPRLAPLPPIPSDVVRVLGWQGAEQALIWAVPRSDTWYAHLIGGQARPVFGQRIRVRLAGMPPGAALRATWLSMLDGAELGGEAIAVAADGTVEVPVLERRLDTVIHVHR